MKRLLHVVCALALPACGGEGAIELRHWHLETEGLAQSIELPVHLDAQLPAHHSQYVLRADVDVPTEWRGQSVTLAIPFLSGKVALRANGRDVPPRNEDDWARYRGDGSHLWHIDGAPERLELELSVEHQWPLSGWWDSIPRLSAAPTGDLAYVWTRRLNYFGNRFAAGAGSMIGLLYLFVYLFDRRHRAHGWFALGSGAAAYYGLFWQGGPVPALFGTAEASSVATTVALAQLAAIWFVHRYFDLPRPSHLWTAAFGLILAAALVLRDPFVSVKVLAPAAGLYLIAAAVYQLGVLVPLARRRPDRAGPLLLCWFFLVLTLWPDYLAWMGAGRWLGGVHTGCIGLALFPIIQAAVLSRELTVSLREADQLNAELRRQIADRSAQLSTALSRLQATPRTTPFQPGEVIENRYGIVRALGEGGMGSVYEVERLSDGKHLALKLLRARAATNLARFAREAQIVAHIDHPNVVAIMDIDVTRSGQLFMVMELCPHTLEQEQAQYGKLAFALPILRQMAAGMAAIHAKGVVHRDLKPSNVLLAGSPPQVKIADFGIASLRGVSEESTLEAQPAGAADTAPADHKLTRTGVIMGTIPYMAPELIRGAQAASDRSDMFAFGIIAYQLLSGLYPTFDSQSDGTTSRATPIQRKRPDLAAPLAQLVDRCLDPNPLLRPTAQEAITLLDTQ